MPSVFEATAGAALGVGSDQTGSVTQATNKATGVTSVSYTHLTLPTKRIV